MNNSRIASNISPNNITTNQPLNDRQVLNTAGGYTFKVEIWNQMERFLILGIYGGTFYVNEKDLTKKNVDALKACLDQDPAKYAALIEDVSVNGRASKEDFSIFALAYGCAYSVEARKYVLPKLNAVCRTGSHLLRFMEDYKSLGGGFGRSVRRAIGEWYTSKTPSDLAYQIVKYRNRNSWTHKDVLRVSHVDAHSSVSDITKYIVSGWQANTEYPESINLYEMLKNADLKEAVSLINTNRVVREMVPTEFLNKPEVMNALALKSPVTAMIRNLGNMTRVLDWVNSETYYDSLKYVVGELNNVERLRSGRVHPMHVLTALKQYESGRGMSSTWDVNSKIVGALNTAFRHSLKCQEPTNLRILNAVDTSGSMSASAGTNFNCRQAAAAMSYVTSIVEPHVHNISFSDKIDKANVVLHENMSLDEAGRAFGSGGGTNLSLPVSWALNNKRVFDLIVIYTDNETWVHSAHLDTVWKEYRKKINGKAKLVIASTAANQYTVGDPNDSSVLQAVGFDASLLQTIQTWAVL